MIYQFDSETELIFSALNKNLKPKNKVYMVGGMVRDILMNRPLHDIDLSYCGNVRNYAKEVADFLDASFFMLNQKFQTARIIYKSQTGEKRGIDIVATRENDILVDLAYRDFTVNAIAIDLRDRTKIIDPLNGALDLKRKTLQVCRKDSLINDPVRILRAIRLAVQFNWKISSQTLGAIKNSTEMLMMVSPERKRDELFRIFNLPNSDIALRLLLHFGLFEYCLPEFNLEKNSDLYQRMEQGIITIKELTKFSELIVGKYSTEGAMDIRQGELVSYLGRFRNPLDTYFKANIHQDRSLKSLINFSILYFSSIQISKLSQVESDHQENSPEKLDYLVEKAAKALVLSSAEKKWMFDFLTGILMIENIIQNDLVLNPETAFLFFNRCKFSGIAACLFSLANALTNVVFDLNTTVWYKNLELSRYFLDSYFCHHDEWINPPTFVNGHDIMRVLKINDGKKVGWWINQLKVETIHSNINSYQDAINYLKEHKENSSKNIG